MDDLAILTPDLVNLAQDLNMRVDVWTINNPHEIKVARTSGVNGIITDRPDIAISLRDAPTNL